MTYDSTSDTLEHIGKVQNRLGEVILNLSERADVHDQSKLRSPEKEGFDTLEESLRGLEYGSEAYRANLRSQQPTLEAHYAANSHHPEHFPDGLDGMSLPDLMEMLADWRASTERHESGDIRRSLAINRERFGISDQLYKILENTVEELGW